MKVHAFADALMGVTRDPWYVRAAQKLGLYRLDPGTWCLRRWRGWQFTARWGFDLGYSVYHEQAHIVICLVWGALYIPMPMFITQRPHTEDWNASYGITYFDRAFQLKWRDACKIIHLPWDWTHVRHSYLKADGSLHHHAVVSDYSAPEETCEVWPYTYVLRSGMVQHIFATVNGEEREWRWRWFTWLPFPRKERRSINVAFSEECGERTGSWKGGTVGCGYDWFPGETLSEALYRMERERKF